MKTCLKCGDVKPLDQFPKRKGATDGHRGECKACKNSAIVITPEQRAIKNVKSRAYKLANREKLAAQRKAYRDKNKIKIQLSGILYRAAHAERIRVGQREYYERNNLRISEYFAGRREEKKAYDREYVQANKAKKAEQNARWKRENKDRIKVQRANRKARLQGKKITYNDVVDIYLAQGGKCRYCQIALGDRYHLDHRMPLALGGQNERSNLQVLCPSCNLRKHATHPDVYEKQIGFISL